MTDDTLDEGLSGDEAIIAEAKKRFRHCEEWESEYRVLYVQDLKFADADPDNGWQWDSTMVAERDGLRKPSLTINKTRQHNLQIINDAKQNKPGVNVRPVGDGASYDAAQVFEGVVRHIEYQSNAEVAYDTATTFQVKAGIGYWRVITDYATNDSFDQEIFIRRVKDPTTVYLDPDISEVDGSDAAFGFVFEDVPKKEFDAKYPDYEDISGGVALDHVSDSNNWNSKEYVRVAEYYRKMQKKDRLVTFTDPATSAQIIKRESELPPILKKAFKEVKDEDTTQTRDIVDDEVEWFKIVGNQIVDRRKWPGRYIPIVRVIGEETIIEGKLDRKGHTRAMKDPQRMYNYWPLSLDTPIPTPTGWTKMGDIQVGDAILDDGGKPTNVRGMSDIFLDRKCFRITFDDGSEIVADAEHPWMIEERGKRKSATWEWSTKKLMTSDLQPGKHFIAVSAPLELPAAELPVDPYVLGVWLGDGRSNGGEIAASVEDAPVMTAALCAAGAKAGSPVPNSSGMRIPIYGLIGHLRKIGVVNNKHIPPQYLRASYEQRLALLQGLMDTDGSVNKATLGCSFDNSNPVLMAGVVELIRSLGMKAFVRSIAAKSRLFPSGKFYDCAASERVSFSADIPVFRMERKALIQNALRKRHARRTKRYAIRKIVEVPSVPVRCVSIDSPSHLFLAGLGMVPTHNTSEATAQVALQTKSPYIAPAEAIEGLQTYWEKLNIDDSAVLPYNEWTEDGRQISRPQREQPPVMSGAYVKGMEIAQNEMMMASGQYQSQFGQNENATSGKAINERQRQGDNATYHFIDNLAIAIRFTGKILIDLIPKVYDTPRIIRILAKDGSESHVKLDPMAGQAYTPQPGQTQQQPQDNTQQIVEAIFNPNVGRYEVESDIGPAYATRRQEAWNAFQQIAAQNKDFLHIAGDLMFKAADFPMADEIAERMRRTIPPNILGDGPPPQDQQMMAKIQQMQGIIAKQAQELADKAKELDIKQQDAITRRLTAEGNAGPIITPEQLRPLIMQTLVQAFQGAAGGQPGGSPMPPEPSPAQPPQAPAGGAPQAQQPEMAQ